MSELRHGDEGMTFNMETPMTAVQTSYFRRLRAVEAAAREVVRNHHVPVNGGPLGHKTSQYIDKLRKALGEGG